ncbi:MAG TPA: ATP-binding protein, partial [Burkholderiaceae bacterium]
AMGRLLGRAPGELAGRRLREFAPQEWQQAMHELSTHRAGALAGREIPLARPDGSIAFLEWSVAPHVEPGLTMVAATDVEERMLLARQRQQLLERERAARNEAEQVSRLKDDFIAVLSHELRTPLNAIMGWVHVLQQRGGSEETVRGLAAIERNGRAQARMISDLLDMSRLNLGKLPLSFAPLDPRAEVLAAVTALRPSIEAAGVVVAFEAPQALRPIRADPSRLQQVVWNLLSNAIKFSPRGARIEVGLAEDDDGLCLSVADHGQGIAPGFLPFVFDRFAQSDAASNRQRGGLGLGLAIVKQLVEAHGGSVTASSEGPGRGARFEVRLPAEATPPPGAEWTESSHGALDAVESPRDALHGAQLLVVEDDAEAVSMLQVILRDCGGVVRTARDVASALRALHESRPDVLVSDVGLPGQDGYDLIRELRLRELRGGLPHLPAVALTSFTREQDRRQALAAGFDAHVAKPLKPLILVQQIRQLLERRP